MIFGTSASLKKFNNITVKYHDSELVRADHFKYSGLILDPSLIFSHHVDYIHRKMVSRLRMLYKVRPVVTEETSLQLYKSLCVPIFYYCDIVYDCLMQRDIHRLQKLQNSALRIVCRKGKDFSLFEMHTKHNIDLLVN